MATYNERMMQLWNWLKKTNHEFQGLDHGIGQIAIGSSSSRVIVDDSHFWVNDFIEGRTTARNIHKALKEGVSPDEIAARKRPVRKRKHTPLRSSDDGDGLVT